MKKTLIILLLGLLFCNTSFAELYFFNECKISNAVTGNYTINIEKSVIEVTLKTVDGKIQNFTDKIKLIEKNKIISEKIKSGKGEELYYQYFLNSKTKSVIKLQYKKESGIDMDIFKLDEKRVSYCTDVKADWNKQKIEEAKISKEQKQILKAQEEIKKEQSALTKCQNNDYEQWTNCKGSYKTETGHKYTGIFKDGKIL